jgi:hypothetical protein
MSGLADMEREYLQAQAAADNEYARFAATTSPRYSPVRLAELSTVAARAKRAWLEAKYGPRDRSRD